MQAQKIALERHIHAAQEVRETKLIRRCPGLGRDLPLPQWFQCQDMVYVKRRTLYPD